MSNRDDLPGDPQQDIKKIKRTMRNDRSWTLPALVEIVFLSLTGLAGLTWFAAMFLWVPDPVSGQVWLGSGILAGLVLGPPTLALYLLRRRGIRGLRRALGV